MAQFALPSQKLLSGSAVDAPVKLGDDGFAVLGDDEGLAFGQLADFFGAQDGNVVGGDAAAAAGGLPAPRSGGR